MGAANTTTKTKPSNASAKQRGESFKARAQQNPLTARSPGASVQVCLRSHPVDNQKRPVGPKSRIGTTKEAPIIVNDEDEDEEDRDSPKHICQQPASLSSSSSTPSPMSCRTRSPVSSDSPPMCNYKQAPLYVGSSW
jgi:hypothetical protein